MGWKEFFKPSWKKVFFIVGVILYLSLVFFISKNFIIKLLHFNNTTENIFYGIGQAFFLPYFISNSFLQSVGFTWQLADSISVFFLFLSPIVWYLISAVLSGLYKRYELKRFFGLNWFNTTLSFIICIFLLFMLFSSEAQGDTGKTYYYFPFYTHAHTGVVIGPSILLLTINLILGSILFFPVLGILGGFFYRKISAFEDRLKKLDFFRPKWEKILVLLILLHLCILLNITLFPEYYAFRPNYFIGWICLAAILLYSLSCLIIWIYERTIKKNQNPVKKGSRRKR
jgi:hypothetical protein